MEGLHEGPLCRAPYGWLLWMVPMEGPYGRPLWMVLMKGPMDEILHQPMDEIPRETDLCPFGVSVSGSHNLNAFKF